MRATKTSGPAAPRLFHRLIRHAAIAALALGAAACGGGSSGASSGGAASSGSSGSSSSGTGSSSGTAASSSSSSSGGSSSGAASGSSGAASSSGGSSSGGAASGSSSSSGSASRPLGINLSGVSYYSSEQPFLNLLKSGGSSSTLGGSTGWYTASDSSFDTGEEAYLQLDSDGYAKSLAAAPAPAGGQQFTYLQTLLDFNMPAAPPGAASAYPAGVYRLKFEGQGTLQLAGDAVYAGGDSCSSSLSLSNAAADSYVSCTFSVTTPGANGGILLRVTAIANSTDYPRDISVVLASQAAQYDAGAIFNPAFLAAIAPFSNLRFMDWSNANGEFSAQFVSDTAIAAGATSASLQSAWPYPSGSYPIVFIDGEQRSASFTLGASRFSWSGGLANSLSSANNWQWGNQQYYAPLWLVTKSWAQRPLPSNAFWSLAGGVPLEVQVALANRIGASAHFNVPLMYADADIAAMAHLVMSGSGMQAGYAALGSGQSAAFELSNEVWNYGFSQAGVAASLGGSTWPAQDPSGGNYAWNRNWFGMRVAQMATDLQTALGSSLFARVTPVFGAQAASTYSATYALATPYWSAGPASSYPIKAIAIAPYWGGNPSAADCAAMTGQSDGGLADFFATLYSQTGAGGQAYSSVPTGGWLGQAQGWIGSYASAISAYTGMQLIAYEGGQNFYATTTQTCGGWPALVTAAERDTRMGSAYGAYLSYWAGNVGAGSANIDNLYNDVGPISGYGAWGLLESILQPISPLSAAPPKYQAAVNYIQR